MIVVETDGSSFTLNLRSGKVEHCNGDTSTGGKGSEAEHDVSSFKRLLEPASLYRSEGGEQLLVVDCSRSSIQNRLKIFSFFAAPLIACRQNLELANAKRSHKQGSLRSRG